jgi:hypothetical protein
MINLSFSDLIILTIASIMEIILLIILIKKRMKNKEIKRELLCSEPHSLEGFIGEDGEVR